MQIHLDVLGWLHVLCGWMGVLGGVALLILGGGTTALSTSPVTEAWTNPVAWLLLVGGAVLAAGGAIMVWAGRALVARRAAGRPAALLLALVNICILPFGTALGVYTLWALLNDDARRAFGRRLRAPGAP